MAHPNAGKQWGKPFAPGNRSGGRPKGGFEFSAAIRDATKDGLLMIQVAMKIALDEYAEKGDRLHAIEFLTERMIGRAPIVIEAAVSVRPDLTRLSDQELQLYASLAAKALPDPKDPRP